LGIRIFLGQLEVRLIRSIKKYQFGRLLLFEKHQPYLDHLPEQLGSFYTLL